jgi:hypothetical protein
MLAWALRALPWKTIILNAPTIVDAARQFYATTRTAADATDPTPRAHDSVGALRRAVEELEAREVQQAALFAEMAKQVQDIATAVEVLRARLTLALWGAGLAGVIAIISLVLTLAR